MLELDESEKINSKNRLLLVITEIVTCKLISREIIQKRFHILILGTTLNYIVIISKEKNNPNLNFRQLLPLKTQNSLINQFEDGETKKQFIF